MVNLYIMEFELPLEHKHAPKPPKERLPDPGPLPPAGLPSSPKSLKPDSESQIFPVQPPLFDIKPVKHFHKPELAVSISTDVSRFPANQILKVFLPDSKKAVSGYLMKVTYLVNEEIYKRKRVIEDRVYNSQISESREYLQHIYQTETDIKRMTRHFLEGMIEERAQKVAVDIQNGEHSVERKKIYSKEELNDLVHYREGELKAKIVDLRDSMKNSVFSSGKSEPEEVFNNRYYDQNHPKTKEAEEFVRKMNQEKEQLRRKFAEARKRKKQAEQKAKKQEENSYKEHLSQRHGKVKQRYDLRKQIKIKEDELRKKKLAQFHQFLKEYKLQKPLYKKKQEQFNQKILSPMQEEYDMKLELIRQKYRPPNYEDLDEHERRYLQYKRDNQIRKQQQMRLVAEAHKNGNRFFKGKYRLQVLQDMVTERQVEDPRMIERLKKVRQLVYSDNVKSRFIPKVSVEKRREIEQMIQKQQQKNKFTRRPEDYRQFLGENGSIFRSLVPSDETGETRNPKLDGRRNLESLHRMIENYRRQGKIKRPVDEQRSNSVTLQPKTNYLQELRRKRQSQTKRRYDDSYYESTKLQDVDEFQRLKMKADLLDQHALRRQKYMRVVKDQTMNGIQEGKNLEEDYLASIKAKMSLLNTNEFSIA